MHQTTTSRATIFGSLSSTNSTATLSMLRWLRPLLLRLSTASALDLDESRVEEHSRTSRKTGFRASRNSEQLTDAKPSVPSSWAIHDASGISLLDPVSGVHPDEVLGTRASGQTKA